MPEDVSDKYIVKPSKGITGEIEVPGDKSISHRSIILGAIAEGVTTVKGFLRGEDNFSTLKAFGSMGVRIDDDGTVLKIHGVGLNGLKEPEDVIDCGNSGTTMRILSGLLAGQPFFSVLTGDKYLRRRPMKRIIKPLSMMGGEIIGRSGGEKAPLAIIGKKLKGISYESPVSSAQIKSAVLLAGLYAEGETLVKEPQLSRDHSERMLKYFGADIKRSGLEVSVSGNKALHGRDITVPGDISSAAFFIVAALIVPNSKLLIRNVGINSTRTGVIDILLKMGGNIQLQNQREVSGEPVADILVISSPLKGVEISGDVVPRAIDEFPVISVAAALAEGVTLISDAHELRVKETDRISAMVGNLKATGVQIEEKDDGMVIHGISKLSSFSAESFGDHRIAMSMIIAGLAANGSSVVKDISSISTSFPDFLSLIKKVSIV
jgi:3-phosphoshikimate 1-carboxyvinyltransferase